MADKNSNIKFWERVAKIYAPIQQKSNAHLYKEVPKRCEKYLSKDKTVLEAACGTGQFTFPLCHLVKSWQATDFSSKMIAESERLAKKKNILSFSLTFSVQDATRLPDEDASFDVVLMANALHIMPEPEKALKEFHRVLKKDGILLVPTFVYEGKFNKFRMKVTEMVGFKTFHHWTSKDIQDVLSSHGFDTVEMENIAADPLPECFIAAVKKG